MLKRFALAAIAALFMTSSASADIIITEIMQNPSAVSDANGEYFEIFNSGGSDVDLNGWTISDDGSDSFDITSSTIVGAGQYFVFGLNGDTGTNGGVNVDFVYSGMFLSNSDDELILTDADTNEVDRVEWDNGSTFPDPNGASMELINIAADNNVGSNWAEATASFGDGDLGTPGSANSVAVPEPASAAVLGLVALGGLFVRRRK